MFYKLKMDQLEDRMNYISELFDLSKNIKPYCVLPIGYSAVEINQKDRYDESRIHKEIYN